MIQVRVEKFQQVFDALLKKHYGIGQDDTGVVDEEIEHLIQHSIRPYQAVNDIAEKCDLERIDIEEAFGMPSSSPLNDLDEIQTIIQLGIDSSLIF